MTLTKADITKVVAAKNGWSPNESSKYVELVLEIMKGMLASGEDIMISGFGKFSVKEKHERKGRNPAKDEDMILPARRVVTFKGSGRLRNRINGDY
jgi:integration host factor subunit alpha